MFILMISRGVPTPQDPQWGCFEKDQAESLANLGHKVVVASIDCRFRLRWRHIGITHHSINGVNYYDSFLLPSAITQLFGKGVANKVKEYQLRRIYEMVCKTYGKPDVIYGQFFYNSYTALPISVQENIPLVTIEHAARFNEEHIDSESLSQSRTVYQHTAANIAVSESLKVSLAKLFGIDCYVVHNVYGKEFKYSPTKPSVKVRYVTTGSLIYRKGFDMFAKAFALLNLPEDKWELTIIGEGEERANLQQQIEQNGFANNIHLAGSKNKTDIARMLNESDVFVLPSRNENFSVAVLEALACGLPVVASICGGIRECIDEKNGVLFEVDDVEGLAKCLKHMYDHHQDYNRQLIADDCKARFSSQVIAKQLTEIFEKVR